MRLPFLLLTFTFLLCAPIAFAHDYEGGMAVIRVDESGFVPDQISVPLGTTVRFENVGTEDHWPASDRHPSHAGYDGTDMEGHCGEEAGAGFDACGAVPPGNAWSFPFDRPGAFGYHDHLWPHLTGHVLVTDTDAASQGRPGAFTRLLDALRTLITRIAAWFADEGTLTALRTGRTGADAYDALATRYEAAVSRSDPREAIRALEAEAAQDADVSARCHDVLHEIGRAAYVKYGSFREAVRFQDDYCNSGYVHGLFEAHFAAAVDPLAGLTEACEAYASSGGRPFDRWQCYHGVGHGFMYFTGGDLDASLSLCADGLGKEVAAICRNGAYMEAFNLEVLAKERDLVDPDDPFATCAARTAAKADCYLYLPAYLSQTAGMAFADILHACKKAGRAHERACVRGTGSEASKRNPDDPDGVFALCRQAGPSDAQRACINGAVHMRMNLAGSLEAGAAMCERAPKAFRAHCDQVVQDNEPFFAAESADVP